MDKSGKKPGANFQHSGIPKATPESGISHPLKGEDDPKKAAIRGANIINMMTSQVTEARKMAQHAGDSATFNETRIEEAERAVGLQKKVTDASHPIIMKNRNARERQVWINRILIIVSIIHTLALAGIFLLYFYG